MLSMWTNPRTYLKILTTGRLPLHRLSLTRSQIFLLLFCTQLLPSKLLLAILTIWSSELKDLLAGSFKHVDDLDWSWIFGCIVLFCWSFIVSSHIILSDKFLDLGLTHTSFIYHITFVPDENERICWGMLGIRVRDEILLPLQEICERMHASQVKH